MGRNLKQYTPVDYGGKGTLLRMERDHIKKVLTIFEGSRKQTANALDISERSLYDKMQRHNI